MFIKKISKKFKKFKSKRFLTKRNCYFTEHRIEYIDYKNGELLRRFISRSGEILPRKVTGTHIRFQTTLAKAIRRARFIGIIGPTTNRKK